MAESSGQTMTMWQHISEFASRFKIMIIAFGIASSIGFFPADHQGYSDPLSEYSLSDLQ